MPYIRVVIVDESLENIRALKAIFDSEPGIQAVAYINNTQKALVSVKNLRPDVVICSMNYKDMPGNLLLNQLANNNPVPVIAISKYLEDRKTALLNGAVSFMQIPPDDEEKVDFPKKVIAAVYSASRKNPDNSKLAAVPEEKYQNTANNNTALHYFGKSSKAVIAIGASTGGTEAIVELVKDFPANFPPVLITQHMPAGFTAMYARRLEDECGMRVQEAKDGVRLGQGMMILAAGESHLKLHKDVLGYYISSRKGEKVSGHIPSVDVLFQSVAEAAGNKAVGIILTGMGADGAKGLLSIRKAGGYTIGQDQKTSVVYGMPMAAYKAGAVKKQLPLGEIAAELTRYLNGLK